MGKQNKSRFKINKRVAEKLGMVTDKELLSPHVLTHDYNTRYPHTLWARLPEQPWEQFCFTENPEEWGKLVQEHKINIHFEDGDVYAIRHDSKGEHVKLPEKDVGLAVCLAFLEEVDSLDPIAITIGEPDTSKYKNFLSAT